MEISGFQRLISWMPRGFSVLDVGAGGLLGENTTDYLLDRFGVKNYLGVCSEEHQVGVYQARRNEAKKPYAKIRVEDFYGIKFWQNLNKKKFDLVVLDLNIENNLKNWTEGGLAQMKDYVKPGGYLINYIMMTDKYGDEDKTPDLINSAWRKFYGSNEFSREVVGKKLQSLDGWELVAQEMEERRPYIMWVLLKNV